MISIKIIVAILFGMILIFILYNSYKSPPPDDDIFPIYTKSPNSNIRIIGNCKYSAWSDCNCQTMKKTSTLLEGDPRICSSKNLLSQSCRPDPTKCCIYGDWQKCDCNNYKQYRDRISGQDSYCGTSDLSRDCPEEDIKTDCCEYSDWKSCNCLTRKRSKDLNKGDISFCTDDLQENCSDNNYISDCCIYSTQEFCDCSTNKLYKERISGDPSLCIAKKYSGSNCTC